MQKGQTAKVRGNKKTRHLTFRTSSLSHLKFRASPAETRSTERSAQCVCVSVTRAWHHKVCIFERLVRRKKQFHLTLFVGIADFTLYTSYRGSVLHWRLHLTLFSGCVNIDWLDPQTSFGCFLLTISYKLLGSSCWWGRNAVSCFQNFNSLWSCWGYLMSPPISFQR